MRTYRVSTERVIDAPVAAVWEVVDDTSRYAEWVDGVIAVTSHHGAAAVGASYAEHHRTVGPLTARSTWTVREVVTHELRVDSGVGLAPLRDLVNTFRFAPEDDGSRTRMTYQVEFGLALGPLNPIVARLLSRSLTAEFQRSMEALDGLAATGGGAR